MKSAVRRLLYTSGLLGLYHRLRNRNTLTVLMFHRVLDPGDPRWRTCDPDYTLSARLFRECLELVVRHYTIVRMDDVLRARDGAIPLPPRSLLITFDDGWQDNFEYALPVLRRMALPAAIFVVGEAVDRKPAYFQERIVAAWRSGKLDAAALGAMRVQAGIGESPDGDSGLPAVRRVIAALESLDPDRRRKLLARFEEILDDDQRHNLSASELRQMADAGVCIGAHGMTHTPLTLAASVEAEVVNARRALARLIGGNSGAVDTLSCPHGQYSRAVVETAMKAGCRLVFTSDPALNDVLPRPSHLLARVGLESGEIADERGRFDPGKMLTLLFRRPIARLD